MKQIFATLIFICCLHMGWSQENVFLVSGGYAFANIEDFGDDATGWRINAAYEYNPYQGKLSHGISLGYISTTATNTNQTQKFDYTINSWPIYYAPKFMFGSGKLRGFVKGALGMHFSDLKRTGPLGNISASDSGFYGGASLGGMVNLTDTVFINLEYEWAYLSNSFYRDGFMNSAMAGIGFKF